MKGGPMEKLKETKTKKTDKPENFFSKEQLLHAKRFQGRKDILNALLEPDRQYTVIQAEQLVESYMKGKVE